MQICAYQNTVSLHLCIHHKVILSAFLLYRNIPISIDANYVGIPQKAGVADSL